MSRREPAKPNGDAVPAAVAERLLERASLLDAVREDAVPLAHLRAAAMEAGIAPPAFAAALAELRAEGAPRLSTPARSVRRRWIAGAGVALVLAGGVLAAAWQRTGADSAPAIPTVEGAVLLRCLTPGEAAELLRPLIADRGTTVRFNPTLAPRVLTLRTTPEKLARAKALLAEHEAPGAGACATPPVPAPAP